VPAAIAAAAVSFYFLCRWLRIEEFDEALRALGGRFLSRLKRR